MCIVCLESENNGGRHGVPIQRGHGLHLAKSVRYVKRSRIKLWFVVLRTAGLDKDVDVQI